MHTNGQLHLNLYTYKCKTCKYNIGTLAAIVLNLPTIREYTFGTWDTLIDDGELKVTDAGYDSREAKYIFTDPYTVMFDSTASWP